MRNDPKKHPLIPDNLVIALIVHAFIGWGFLWLTKINTGRLNYNSYLALLPAAVFVIPVFFSAAKLHQVFPGKDIIFIYRKLLGNWLGTVFGAVFLTLVLFFLSGGVRISLIMVMTYFFQRTPYFFIMMIFWAVVLYLVLHGIRAISRLAGFMLIPPLLIIYLLVFMGLFYVHTPHFRPCLAGTPAAWFEAAFDLIFVFYPVYSIFLYLPYIRRTKSVVKIGISSLALILPLFFLSILGAVGVFGIQAVEKMAWPTMEFFHIIDFPILLLEQAGLLFIITWYAFNLVAISQTVCLVSKFYRELCSTSMELGWFTVGTSLLILILAGIPLNITQIYLIFNKLNNFITVILLLIGIVPWMAALIRFRRDKPCQL
ncbi:MAG: GerAB/ArcD/ProY family transporter [Bacillota bacterium]